MAQADLANQREREYRADSAAAIAKGLRNEFSSLEACSDVAGRQMTGPGLKIDGPVPEYSITLGPGPE